MAEGLVSAESVAVDASLIAADASTQRSAPRETQRDPKMFKGRREADSVGPLDSDRMAAIDGVCLKAVIPLPPLPAKQPPTKRNAELLPQQAEPRNLSNYRMECGRGSRRKRTSFGKSAVVKRGMRSETGSTQRKLSWKKSMKLGSE